MDDSVDGARDLERVGSAEFEDSLEIREGEQPFNEAQSIQGVLDALEGESDNGQRPTLPATDLPVQAIPQVRKDEVYYMHSLVVLVDGCLFKVPRAVMVENSDYIREKLQEQENEPSGLVYGADDDHPLRLDGIKLQEFRWLLAAVFPTRGQYTFTYEQWIVILDLSTRLGFTEVRNLAIRRSEECADFVSMDLLDRVALGFRHQVDPWLLSAVQELAKRDAPLSETEFQRLGFVCAAKVAAVRESFRGDRITVTCGSCARSKATPVRANGKKARGKSRNSNFGYAPTVDVTWPSWNAVAEDYYDSSARSGHDFSEIIRTVFEIS
ncbi:hypothetical protein JAAARDRAFT_27660 [Jaapia argillacea MUCL 33604]|uniref:BTB domain-containing protein n=1 Tax=Jaapia argillacea MUCL 33604 TaxID=933084 RepID=A0A067QKF9_9AGAM|nr:hypothetical protein JAAARDRAFT_27660 [Jaapia argillacea MUCL 33604]